jgi:hypothetical protein
MLGTLVDRRGRRVVLWHIDPIATGTSMTAVRIHFPSGLFPMLLLSTLRSPLLLPDLIGALPNSPCWSDITGHRLRTMSNDRVHQRLQVLRRREGSEVCAMNNGRRSHS